MYFPKMRWSLNVLLFYCIMWNISYCPAFQVSVRSLQSTCSVTRSAIPHVSSKLSAILSLMPVCQVKCSGSQILYQLYDYRLYYRWHFSLYMNSIDSTLSHHQPSTHPCSGLRTITVTLKGEKQGYYMWFEV